MISTIEAEPHLEAALSEAGFRHAAPDPRLAWRAFREFTAVPVAVADDAFVFQCGVYDFSGRELWHWNLTRQFTHEEDGEHAGMEQLQLTIFFEPDAELRTMAMSLWSANCGSVEEWFARVEALPAFAAAFGRAPVGCEVMQETV
ncbi:MAG TPA: hypothetical protein VFS05_15375 [Gemmatimonadaceae bacterium]|nr:hypothetical protein [Gemmatimonadaceae bacterium]